MGRKCDESHAVVEDQKRLLCTAGMFPTLDILVCPQCLSCYVVCLRRLLGQPLAFLICILVSCNYSLLLVTERRIRHFSDFLPSYVQSLSNVVNLMILLGLLWVIFDMETF